MASTGRAGQLKVSHAAFEGDLAGLSRTLTANVVTLVACTDGTSACAIPAKTQHSPLA